MDETKKDYNNTEPIVDQPVEQVPTADMSKRSRINKRLVKQSRKNLIISVLGLILLALILFKFGIPLIADLGFLSSQVAGPKDQETKSEEEEMFLASPTLHDTFSATNSARVNISGSSTTGEQIAIYVNGSMTKKVDLKDGNFETNITLSDGENLIKARSVQKNKQSDFSNTLIIDFRNSPPSLSIDTPHDGDTVKNSPINVGGKTDPDNRVTVNGFQAIVDSSGGYSYSAHLQNGDNNISVVAIDNAGNQTEKRVKITYSP